MFNYELVYWEIVLLTVKISEIADLDKQRGHLPRSRQGKLFGNGQTCDALRTCGCKRAGDVAQNLSDLSECLIPKRDRAGC